MRTGEVFLHLVEDMNVRVETHMLVGAVDIDENIPDLIPSPDDVSVLQLLELDDKEMLNENQTDWSGWVPAVVSFDAVREFWARPMSMSDGRQRR